MDLFYIATDLERILSNNMCNIEMLNHDCLNHLFYLLVQSYIVETTYSISNYFIHLILSSPYLKYC